MGSNVSSYFYMIATCKLRVDYLRFSSLSCSDLCFRQCGRFHERELQQRGPQELRNKLGTEALFQ